MTDRIKITDTYAGEEHGAWTIDAVTARGERFHLRHLFADEEAAWAVVRKIQAVGSIDPDLWNEGYPVYGSPAWQDEDAEAMVYRMAVASGLMGEDDARIPDAYRALL